MNNKEVLYFSIGSFSEDYEKIIWKNDRLYHFYERSFVDEDFTVPSPKDWEEFWDKVDILGVWNWKKE